MAASYYFFETQDLPLFGPLRTLGVPESLIDVVEPTFRVIVDLAYDRSIPPWEPTPARLIPTLDPVTVAGDLFNGVVEGINNAAASFISSPAPHSSPTLAQVAALGPVDAAPAAETGKADVSAPVASTEPATEGERMSTNTVASTVTSAHTQQGTSTEPASGNEETSTDTTTSTKVVTETANADEASTGPAAGAAESSVSAFTPESAKAATPRPVVRGSLGVSEQLRDRPHRGNDDQPTTRTAAASDGGATAENSSVASSEAASSSTGSDSSDRDTSSGDAVS